MVTVGAWVQVYVLLPLTVDGFSGKFIREML